MHPNLNEKKRRTCEKHEYNMNDKKEWDSA